MRDDAKEHEYLEEAERLGQLPRQDQEAVVEMYRHLAANPLATPACRAGAEQKAAALEKLLGLTRKTAKATDRAQPSKVAAKRRKP